MIRLYKKIIRPILFEIDPENIHNKTIKLGRLMNKLKLSIFLKKSLIYKNKILENNIAGVLFKNPIGLAAGFDKNAHLINFMGDMGFGFVEVGSLTALACKGNKKPRLHRLIKNKGIIVNYGLANDGAKKIYSRLNKKKFRIPFGVSIAKTNNPFIKGKNSINDYVKSFEIMKKVGNYITINISCPNVGDGRSFEDPVLLEKLLKKIFKIRKKEIVFLKISPDISRKILDEIMKLSKKYDINGFVVSNLTKNRKGLEKETNLKFEGGISGKIVKGKSNKMIEYIYRKSKGKFLIIGCGGVFDGYDAYEKIKKGSSLVQLISGMIYEGPFLIKRINKEIAYLLKKDGFKNIKDAIGKDVINKKFRK